MNDPPIHNTRHFPAACGEHLDVCELVRAGGRDREVTENRVRIEHESRAINATLDGDTVTGDGTEIKINQGRTRLAPVTPGKIIATHLTYRSRAEEYKMARLPSEPSDFMRPPSSLTAQTLHVASTMPEEEAEKRLEAPR